jgi:hypothetical protein
VKRVVVAVAGVLLGSVTAQAAVEVRTLAAGAFEASGATSVPGGEGILFVDDGRPGEVLWMRLGPGGTAGEVVPVRLGGTIPDPEGITNDGTWIYVVGSQSRGGNAGADLIRFRFDAKTGAATGLESMQGLPNLVGSVVPEVGGDTGRSGKKGKKGKNEKKAAGLNIEGLAWDAARKRLLLGVRSPLAGGDALVVPLAIADGPLSPKTVSVEAALRLPLGGGGIRSIEQVSGGGFLVVAGGVTDASNFRLLTWNGTGAPQLVTDFPTELKPEGVARITSGGRSFTVILGDSGRYAVLD